MTELGQVDAQIIVNHCPGLSLGPHLKIGGQKRVWRCAFNGDAYVLKAIMANDRALRRVKREIEIMRKCDSRFLPKFGPIPLRELVLPSGEKVVYFLEEYIDGMPLASVHMPMTAEQVVWLGRCVAEALGVLAAHDYVHRDVKPMNILQKTSSTYVLIDAGVALDRDGEAISMDGAMPVGTPFYFSPEQIMLPSRELDGRSDLFSLGICMYECATGEHRFSNDHLPCASILRNIVELAPPDPQRLTPELPDALCGVIGRLLQKDRGRRYQSPEELLADLPLTVPGDSPSS